MSRRYDPSKRSEIRGVPRGTWNTIDARIMAHLRLLHENVQSISSISPDNGQFIVGDGSGWVGESGATARASMGVSIGADVQAFASVLDDLSALGAPTAAGQVIVATGAGVFAYFTNPGASAFTYNNTFAEIHLHDESTAVTVATGTTYTKIDLWTDNGESNDATPDQANDKITITRSGRYLVMGSLSGYSDTANVTFKISAFLDGTEQDNVHCERKFANANDIGSMSLSGIIDVTSAPLDLDLRARHDNGAGVDLTLTYANLSILRVAGT